VIDRSFFERPCVEVARDLLGRHLQSGPVTLRITEVEAYDGPEDSACHAKSGRTARNEAIWGVPGTAYVYVCYGIHRMLNVVAGAEGRGSAALVRACEIVAGADVVAARRRGKTGPQALAGPGRVGAALAVDLSYNGHDLVAPGGLRILPGSPPERVLVGPRVGIDYALPHHRDAPWRFACADTRWVSVRRSLRAEHPPA
jgi:DNA-3-methyladenine glycosylase